jgi:hypothetical protein
MRWIYFRIGIFCLTKFFGYSAVLIDPRSDSNDPDVEGMCFAVSPEVIAKVINRRQWRDDRLKNEA